MTFAINQAIFILINLLMAGNDAIKIKKHKPVEHLMNGIVYCLSIFVFILIFEMRLFESLVFTVCCFANRQLSFDIPLNLMRKLKWDYVSPSPESFIDKVEKYFFKDDGRTPVYIYTAIFVVTLIVSLCV